MVEALGWRELLVFLSLVALVAAFRRETDLLRRVLMFGSLACIALAVLWPKGMVPVATCTADTSEAPRSVTEDADGLGDAFDALDEWAEEQGTQRRFFTTRPCYF